MKSKQSIKKELAKLVSKREKMVNEIVINVSSTLFDLEKVNLNDYDQLTNAVEKVKEDNAYLRKILDNQMNTEVA